MHRFAVLVVLIGSVAVADDDTYTPPDFLSAVPTLPNDADATAWHLTLGEAIQIAVKQNLSVVLERDQIETTKLGEIVAAGPYEPALSVSYAHGAQNTPPSTIQAGSASEILTNVNDSWTFDLRKLLETGTSIDLSANTARGRSNAGTAVEPLVYNAGASLSITQPLLKGFSLDGTIQKLGILHARIASERERKTLAVTMTGVVERTEDAYWGLVQAIHSYDLSVSSEKLAEDQLVLSKRQLAAGLLAPGDLLSAESTVAQRELSVVQAEQAIEAAADQLRATLNLPRDQWSRPILPTDPPTFAPQAASPDEAMKLAVASRPELAQANLDIAAEDLSVRQVENAKLPEIDLGISGSLVGQDSTFHGATHQLASTDANTWQVMMTFTWTPLHRATSAAAEIEHVRRGAVVAQRDQLVTQIYIEVRDAVRAQSGAARSVFAAAKARVLAEQVLAVEQKKFLNNQSQNFLVAQRQQELAGAQLAELSAVLDYQKASAALLRATGRLLAARNIELR